MSTITAHTGVVPHAAPSFKELRGDNITPPTSAKGPAAAFLGIGVLGLGVTVAAGMMAGKPLHALAAYHVGASMALTMSLGSMFLVMVIHLTNAGWASTLRRQCENVMALVPWCALMVLAGIVIDSLVGKSGNTQLWSWLHDSQADNALLHAKSGFLNAKFFVIRAAIYLTIWTVLSRSLLSLSLKQDLSPDVKINAKARSMSSWGMLIFALSIAFAAFDWIMSLDFTFFSTMWGVYVFAGSAYSAIALLVLILAWLRGQGKLRGVVTSEHFHDVGKLLFAFTVFWAYIAFSQYFLIWYSNVPEETAFFNARVGSPSEPGGPSLANPWVYVGAALIIMHFALPFPILLFRAVKQRYQMLSIMAVLALVAHLIDLFWMIRPVVYAGHPEDLIGVSAWWIDAAGIVGPLGVFGFLVMRRILSCPLVAVNDAWIGEGMQHKNYV